MYGTLVVMLESKKATTQIIWFKILRLKYLVFLHTTFGLLAIELCKYYIDR